MPIMWLRYLGKRKRQQTEPLFVNNIGLVRLDGISPGCLLMDGLRGEQATLARAGSIH